MENLTVPLTIFCPRIISIVSIDLITFSSAGKSNRCFNDFFEQRLDFAFQKKIETMVRLAII